MDRSDVIYLLWAPLTQDENGIWSGEDGYVEPNVEPPVAIDEPEPIPFSEWSQYRSREVFCDVKSITRTEWFEAGRNGIEHPEFIFVMNRNEYDGERLVLYKGKVYGVYRTYEAKNENLELYVEAKGGLKQ